MDLIGARRQRREQRADLVERGAQLGRGVGDGLDRVLRGKVDPSRLPLELEHGGGYDLGEAIVDRVGKTCPLTFDRVVRRDAAKIRRFVPPDARGWCRPVHSSPIRFVANGSRPLGASARLALA
jgi:hypothetical protein